MIQPAASGGFPPIAQVRKLGKGRGQARNRGGAGQVPGNTQVDHRYTLCLLQFGRKPIKPKDCIDIPPR